LNRHQQTTSAKEMIHHFFGAFFNGFPKEVSHPQGM
jgi:hypothetical protein